MQLNFLSVSVWITLIIGLLLSACTPKEQTPDDPTGFQGFGEDTSALTITPEIAQLSQAILKEPSNALLLAQRAQLLYDNEQYEFSAADWEKALSLDSTELFWYHSLADAYLDNYQSKKSLETLYRLAARDTTRIPTLLKLSEFQHILTMFEPSMNTVSRILDLDPQSADGFYMMGRNFEAMGDTARAINAFQEAVEIDPDNIDSYLKLGILFDALKNPISLQYFNNALRIDSTDFDALFAYGYYYFQRNDLEKAIEWYSKAARFHPKNPRVHFNNGFAKMELNRIEEARRDFELAINVEPGYGTAYYYRGLMNETLLDTAAAIQDYRQAATLVNNYTVANDGLFRLGAKPIIVNSN
ncbi:MAG: tetratricopeptide repeat protein [Bacteroidota bacterium]